ncbi:MAG: MarP family serine protease [Actinobacteria bacterium]|nr:MarP family serine protease [Actinomycetota bacterium]
MSWLDLAAIVVIGLSALSGFRRGLLVGVLSLVGLVVGAIVGSRIAPSILGQADSRFVPLIALGGAVVGSFLAQAAFALAGRRVRTLLIALPPLKALDHVLGFFLGAATGLAFCWVVGAVMLYLPGQAGLRETAQRSSVLSTLNEYLPPAKLMETLARSDPFAMLAGPEASVGPPNPDVVDANGVRRARPSVLRVRGYACGLGVEGSGWIAGPGVVVTAAHVVAGLEEVFLDRNDGARPVIGRVVAFDQKNDLAVVRAPRLEGAALRLGDPESGTPVALLGFPGNGPYQSTAARIGQDVTFLSRDAYGNFPVTRTVTTIRGVVEPGNSGGPAVTAAGEVVTTVFGARVGGRGSGYGVPNGNVRRLLASAGDEIIKSACAAD